MSCPDVVPSDLHVSILMAAPFEPSDDLIVRQLTLLSDQIDRAERSGDLNLCEVASAAYRALMWARSPRAFAPPVDDEDRS